MVRRGIADRLLAGTAINGEQLAVRAPCNVFIKGGAADAAGAFLGGGEPSAPFLRDAERPFLRNIVISGALERGTPRGIIRVPVQQIKRVRLVGVGKALHQHRARHLGDMVAVNIGGIDAHRAERAAAGARFGIL